MHRTRLQKREYRHTLHSTHRVCRSSRRGRSTGLCIPILYSPITPTYYASPPSRVSNSAGATPVRATDCGLKSRTAYSPELPRPPSANSAELHVCGKINNSVPTFSPPGPPASPVPSPSGDSFTAPPIPTSSEPLNSSLAPNFIRVKLRKRRNAICSQTPMAKGLRDFLVSYIVSHLTDSMTSSLNLTAAAHSMMEEDSIEEDSSRLTTNRDL